MNYKKMENDNVFAQYVVELRGFMNHKKKHEIRKLTT